MFILGTEAVSTVFVEFWGTEFYLRLSLPWSVKFQGYVTFGVNWLKRR